MSTNQGGLKTKPEIAELLGVSVEDIYKWAQQFSDWLDVCAVWRDRSHDEDDVFIFTCIHELNSRIAESFDFSHRTSLIEDVLHKFPSATNIRQRRQTEKKHLEIARWAVLGGENGACLRYEYEWLEPLRTSVDGVADFGCWATTETQTCSEPYALLWTLNATSVTVIDKNSEYIRNAREWLKLTRARYPYFETYKLMFIVGDMTRKINFLSESSFDLSYCQDVLYNMYPDLTELQSSISEMARVVRPGGWIIAIEPKMGVEYKEILGGSIPTLNPASEPVDVSKFFEAAGLSRVSLDNAPDWSYCYRKLHD